VSLNHYLVENPVVMVQTCAVRNPITGAETPTDPTAATFTRVKPDGTIETFVWPGDPETDNPVVGTITCTVTVDVPGMEKWRCVTTGLCECASEDEFKVIRSAVVA